MNGNFTVFDFRHKCAHSQREHWVANNPNMRQREVFLCSVIGVHMWLVWAVCMEQSVGIEHRCSPMQNAVPYDIFVNVFIVLLCTQHTLAYAWHQSIVNGFPGWIFRFWCKIKRHNWAQIKQAFELFWSDPHDMFWPVPTQFERSQIHKTIITS